MPRTCTICLHPERGAIDKALVDNVSFRDIAGRYTVSRSALERHKREHLSQTMVQAAEAEDVAHAIDIVKQLKAINGCALAILSEARKAKDHDIALKAIDRIQKQIELQAKMLGELDERPQVNITLSAEWVSLRAVILTAVDPYPEARRAITEALSAGA